MRISRLFLPQTLAEGATLRLDEESRHYLATVLRLKRGFELTVFNGEDDDEYAAKVVAAGRDGIVLAIGAARSRNAESPLAVHLGLGISRGERMDLAIQKAVELGAARITPLFTEHCVVRLEPERSGQRLRHWLKVARGACEQCGRNRVPEVDEPLALVDWIDGREGCKLFLDPRGTAKLKDLPRPERAVSLLSGPEGGFSERERDLARRAGFVPLRLGPRILRTETAALAALAAMQALWGDLGG